MMSFLHIGAWVKATAFSGLAAFSIEDIIVSRHGLTRENSIVGKSTGEPFVYDATEDRAYWREKFGYELSEAQYLEVRSNLTEFIQALLAPGARLQ